MAKSTKAKKKPAKKKTAAGATDGKAGRPSKFTQALADEICRRLSDGEPLRQICRDDHMPDPATVWRWEEGRPEFVQAIARAREEGLHAIAHSARMTLRGKGEADGGESTGDVQRDKAIAEFDLKLLSKWAPRLYGDKIQHADADGNKLEVPQWIVNPVAPKGVE